MISMEISGCRVDILPVVNGLVSYADKVREAYGRYEAYGASMGIEALEALEKRYEIGIDDLEVSELDIVYAKKMAVFGDVQTPSPAFCEIVDLCTADGKKVIPLDMGDYDFDTAYMECVRATEFTSVHRLAKKIHKSSVDQTSPETAAMDVDRLVSRVGGFRHLSRRREEYIAGEIRDVSKHRSSLLCIIEIERVDGICGILGGYADG